MTENIQETVVENNDTPKINYIIEDEQIVALQDAEKSLTATAYQIDQLYKHISQYEKDFALNSAKQEKLVEGIAQKFDSLSKLEEGMRAKLASGIRGTITDTIKSLNSEITGDCIKEVTRSVEYLNHGIKNAEDTLREYKYQIKNSHLKTILVTTAALVLTNVIALTYLIPKVAMSSLQITYLIAGKSFLDRYEKLSTDDQKRVDDIINKNI